jgi:tellurium resistance protein TerZ
MAINLAKGQKIDLRKSSGETLTSFCVGVNWGMIETYVRKEVVINEGFLGFGKKTEMKTVKENIEVDLDLSCIMTDVNGQICDYLYSPLWKQEALDRFKLPKGKLISQNNALKHSGDDLQGDEGGDDGLDNEIISVDLTKVPDNVDKIFFFLNNAGKEDFSLIPYAKIRMYEGTPTYVKSEFASYNVSSEAAYKDRKAVIMGKLYRKNGEWKFDAIGDTTEDVFFGQTILRILKDYAK